MFEDRVDAGRRLCPKLNKYSKKKNIIIVGLLRGGLITAKAISELLNIKLIPLYVKKLSDPKNQELALGAMVSSKDVYLNEDLIKSLKISDFELNKIVIQKWIELKISLEKYKINKKEFNNKHILLVDDGVATGATVLAAEKYLRKNKAKSVNLVSPVIAQDTFDIAKKHFDAIIYLIRERNFYAVGEYYKNFPQVEEGEIEKILNL